MRWPSADGFLAPLSLACGGAHRVSAAALSHQRGSEVPVYHSLTTLRERGHARVARTRERDGEPAVLVTCHKTTLALLNREHSFDKGSQPTHPRPTGPRANRGPTRPTVTVGNPKPTFLKNQEQLS
jgi:hypothetical protein